MDTKGLTITVLVLAVLVLAIPLSSAADWQQFQRDEQNAGVTDSPAPIEYPELVWSAFTYTSEWGNGIDVTPITAGDMVYIFAANGSIRAFNRTNGDLIWKNETTGGTLQTSTPAYGDGKIFVAAESGDLFAFDAETGDELWNVHVTDKNFECPITYFDHRVYIGEGLSGGVTTKYYYCYSDTGTEIWRHAISNTAGFLWNGAAVVGDYIVFATHEGELISVCRNNGTLADEVDLTSDLSFSQSDLGMVRASVAYHDGYVYTTSEQGQSIGYIFKVGFDSDAGTFNDCGWSTANGFSTSTPVIYDGRVYVGQGEHGYSGNLTCLDDSTGAILWSYPVDAGVKSSPAVSVQGGNPYIYFTGAKNDGSLYCLKGDGMLAWKYNPPDDGYILQGASISDGNVYFGTGAGYLYCIASMETPSLLTAFFTAEPISGTAPLNVTFTDESTGYGITDREWDFGDGDNSTEQNPSHVYAEGTYSVSLTVTNSTGSDTCNRANYITVSASSAPVANFGASITSGYEPLIVSFEDISLNSPDSWEWDFGDGGVSTRPNPKHAYLTPGTYNVSLTVANANGSDTTTAANYITCIEWVVPGWVTGDGWEQFHNDVHHTGFSSSTAPNTNNILWVSDDIGAVSSSSPVITGGRLFVNCGDTVVSLGESTGACLSVHGEGSSAYGSWASPCHHDGNVWCGLNDYPEDAPYSSVNGGTMVADGKVYVGNWDGGQYFCLDVADGGELWNFTVEGADPGAIGGGCAQGTPAYSDGKVYLTSWLYGAAHAGHVYCLDADTGALVWHQNDIPDQCCGSPAIADGIVYATTYNFYDDGEILALDANDGSILWRQTIERTDGTPALAYGNVYVCGGCAGFSDLETYCFNATTGDLIWNTTASEDGIGGWTVSVAVADDTVFVGNSSRYSGCAGTYALDAATGVVIWSSPDGGSSPAVADGIVFTIGGDGRVYAFGEPLKPDLVSISLVPGMFYSNQQNTIPATIANDGAAGATAFNVSLEYDGTTIGTNTISSLDAGVETTTEFSWTPASTGMFDLTVTIDPVDAIDESNETNNDLTRAIRVKESIDWQQFHQDVGHVGFSQSDAPHTNHTAWISDDIGAHTGSSTAIAKGMVFVYCNDYLVCLDEHTGAVLWNVSVEKTPDVCGSWTTPAYNNGNVFISTNRTYCFDATDGSEVWSFAPPTGKGAVNGGCTIADGKVFTSDWDGGYYYCLDVADGSVIWDFAVGGKAQSTPAVSVADGHVFFGSYTGICEDGGAAYCVNMTTGDEIWNTTTDNSFCGSVATGDGVVYLTEYNFYGDGALYALDASNGSEIWSQPVERSDSTPALAYGNVYVSGGVEGMTDLVTYCFNATTGTLLWSTSASDEIGSWKCSVAVADGLVFSGKPYFSYPVMDFVGTYALDSETGDVIWSYPAGGSSPAVANGMVFTIGGGRVYAFRSANVTSCDATGSEKDAFCPGETVYVSGVGLSPDTDYWIRIQDDGVCEGDTLVAGNDPSISQERMTTDVNGDFGPIPIWTIPEGAATTHHEYDIVIDDGDCVYHTSDDGIDSLGTTGFTAPVPELPGIILVAIGLLVMIGFVRRGGGMKK